MVFLCNNRNFIAVIGDIKGSQNLEKRKEIQKRLKEILAEVNIKYGNDIASKFLITLGDEFQGLLHTGKNVLKIIEQIKTLLYPVELRFGIGIGKITTDIDSEMALGADGPAYYNAREAIIFLKENEKKNKAVPVDLCLKTERENSDSETLVNTVFELTKVIEDMWTNRQREIIWDMLKHQDGQKNAASRLGITQSTVHKALAAGNYYAYEKAIKTVENILGEIDYD